MMNVFKSREEAVKFANRHPSIKRVIVQDKSNLSRYLVFLGSSSVPIWFMHNTTAKEGELIK